MSDNVIRFTKQTTFYTYHIIPLYALAPVLRQDLCAILHDGLERSVLGVGRADVEPPDEQIHVKGKCEVDSQLAG